MNALRPQRCHDCHGEDLVTDYRAGDVICRSCGIVQESNMISDEAEVHTATDLYHYHPFDTNVNNNYTKIVSGQHRELVDPNRFNRFANLQRTQLHMTSQRHVNTHTLDYVCRRIHISEWTHKLSQSLLTEVTSFQTCRGDNMLGMQAVALYYACLFSPSKRSIQEICVAFEIVETLFTKADKIFRNAYQDNKSAYLNFSDLFKTADANDMIRRNVEKLSLEPDTSRKVTKMSFRLLELIRQKKILVGRSSGGIAGGVIYSALSKHGVKMSKKEFCSRLKPLTTIPTINTILTELKTNHLDAEERHAK